MGVLLPLRTVETARGDFTSALWPVSPGTTKEVMTMNTRKDWPCKEGPFRCQHTRCRRASMVPAPADAVSAELRSFNFSTIDAVPDGITPDEWRRGMALLAITALARDEDYMTLPRAVTQAARASEWIRTGELPDA